MVAVSGLLEWYYQVSLNHPPSAAGNLVGRSFDVSNNQFTFSLAQATIAMAPTAESPMGFLAQVTFGKTADLVHATEPGGNVGPNGVNDTPTKHLQQVYGTYITGGARPVTIDFGKFVTHMGYELIEASANDHTSRGLLFTYAIPLYHAGLRISAPLGPHLTGQLHLLNGWNNVEDDNDAKSLGAQLSYKPNDRLHVALNWIGGNESAGAGLGTDRNVQVVELVAVHSATPRLRLGLNVVLGGAFRDDDSGSWSGQAFYTRYQATPRTAWALRLERFEDTGLRGMGTTARTVTATYEYTVKGNHVGRLEFRHDGAGRAIFSSGGGTSRSQQTLMLSQAIRF
ncbi:MAG TPA: outer membrane beta-barrel protein [Chthonomonadales bacterium]|nr:outer membrane beta-barrel protein [Chthonomonadales bacterium]